MGKHYLIVLFISLSIEIFILWQIMHYLWTVKDCDNVHYNNNFLVKSIFFPRKYWGFLPTVLTARQPICFPEAYIPSLVSALNNFSRELQLASDPVMIIIIFLIVPLTLLTSQSDNSGERLEDYFHHTSISLWDRVSLSRPGWLLTHGDSPASASWGLGVKAWATTPGLALSVCLPQSLNLDYILISSTWFCVTFQAFSEA